MGREHLYALSGDSSADLRLYLERIEDTLRTDPNAERVRQIADRLAGRLCDRRISALTKSLSPPATIRALRTPAAAPGTRTAQFDAAIDEIISLANDAIDTLQQFERDLAQNDGLEQDEFRRRVLDFLLQQPREAYPGTAEIYIALAVPFDEMMCVLELLKEEGALKTVESDAQSWRVELTARGRIIAKQRTPSPMAQPLAQPPVVLTQHIYNSTIAQAGINYGASVTQNVTFPALPSDVRDALQQSDEGRQLVHALEEETRKTHPDHSLLRKSIEGIKIFVATANLGTQVALHGHEWVQAAHHWLATIRP